MSCYGVKQGALIFERRVAAIPKESIGFHYFLAPVDVSPLTIWRAPQ
jgi:hypothetical protein